MAIGNETFNNELYQLLKVRGYHPTPLNSQNQRVKASQEADVIEFNFIKDGEDYGKVWVSIDDASNVCIYFDDEQADSPSNTTPGTEYDDTWTGLLKHIKQWAQRRQLSFELANKDRLGDDMRQRDYYKMKEKLGESYHPMGKKASYNDAVPNVKIVLQHNRSLEEGEARFRNVAKIYLENVDGERFLAPTTRPGIARVYARHIAEGGVPNDDRWNHIKSICEEYQQMAGFVRATRKGQFNESAQQLVNEGVNHYNNLRETLHKLAGHRGYHNYFESYTPALMEDDTDINITELFVQETMDPRIESVMPILSRLHKKVSETSTVNVDALAEWADNIISEKLETDDDKTDKKDTKKKSEKHDKEDDDSDENVMGSGPLAKIKKHAREKMSGKLAKTLGLGEMDSTTKTLAVPADKMLEAPGAETLAHNQSTEKSNLKAFGLAEEDDDNKVVKLKPKKPPYMGALAKDFDDEFGHYDDLGRIGKLAAINRGSEDDMDWDDDSWIPDEEDFEHEEMAKELSRHRGRFAANDLKEMEKDLYQGRRHDPRKGPQGPDKTAKAIPAKKAAKDAGKLLNKAFKGELDEVLDTRDAKMSYAKKNMDSHKKALDTFMHSGSEDEKADAHKTAMKRVKGLNTFVKNKVSKDEDVTEDLGPEQKRVGQLGPTEKVKNNNIGKLVGASESMNYDDEDLLAEGILDTIKSRVKSFLPKKPVAAPAEPKKAPGIAGKTQQSSGLNDYIKKVAADLNAADPKTKIALVKELVGVMADRKGHPEWDNVIGSVKGILKRAGVNPNVAAAANAKLQAGQTFESAMQEAINLLLESTGLTMQILNESEDLLDIRRLAGL